MRSLGRRHGGLDYVSLGICTVLGTQLEGPVSTELRPAIEHPQLNTSQYLSYEAFLGVSNSNRGENSWPSH